MCQKTQENMASRNKSCFASPVGPICAKRKRPKCLVRRLPGRWRTHMHAYWVRICSHTRDAYAYPILFVFVKHSSKTGTRGGRICFMSRDAYASFPGTHMLRFLGRICARDRVAKHSGQFLIDAQIRLAELAKQDLLWFGLYP